MSHKAKCHFISSSIHNLAKDEYEAMNQYEAFLATRGDSLDVEDVETIQQIIAEEKKHSILLQAMTRKYDGDIPAEGGKDVKTALKAIRKGTGDE